MKPAAGAQHESQALADGGHHRRRGTCLVLGYGARLAMTGRISPGVLIVFLMHWQDRKPMRDSPR